MDFKQLATFVRVAETGSFSRAAIALRVAQPALSRQVRALEIELRQPLFERNGRGVTLTEGGKRLLGHARGILQQVQRARHDLADSRDDIGGLLSIGLPPSLSRTLTSPLVEAFRARFPAATLTVVEGLSTYLLEWLAQGRVDIAVVYNARAGATVDLRAAAREPLYLVSARGKGRGRRLLAPVASLADVAAHDLVIPSRPHAIRMHVESALAEAGLKPRVGLEIESVPAILDLVQRHALHAVLSLNAIQASGAEAAYLARPIEVAPGQPLAASLWIATSSQRPGGRLQERAVELLGPLLAQALAPPAGAAAG